VGCEWVDIDVDGKKTIDKASPFRSESKPRIWEFARLQTDGTMVDVLESGKDTGGGSLDMHESTQRKDKERSSSRDPATLRATPATHDVVVVLH